MAGTNEASGNEGARVINGKAVGGIGVVLDGEAVVDALNGGGDVVEHHLEFVANLNLVGNSNGHLVGVTGEGFILASGGTVTTAVAEDGLSYGCCRGIRGGKRCEADAHAHYGGECKESLREVSSHSPYYLGNIAPTCRNEIFFLLFTTVDKQSYIGPSLPLTFPSSAIL